jgi:hypothetical protein
MTPRAQTKPLKTFEAAIYRVGILYCVDVPAALSKSLGGEKYIPVAGAVNGTPMRGLLVPRGEGQHRLFLDTPTRKRARAGQGDTVTVALGRDTESREVPVPEEVLEALEDEPGSYEALQSLTVAKRRSFLLWVMKVQNPESRAKRIARLVQELAKLSRR